VVVGVDVGGDVWVEVGVLRHRLYGGQTGVGLGVFVGVKVDVGE